MHLIFQDPEVFDVVWGRAIRTVPVDGEPPDITIIKRKIAMCVIYRPPL